MATSLSDLVGNLTEGIHKTKCKNCDCFLEYEIAKDNSIKYESLSCNKNYSGKIDEELKKNSRTNLSFLMISKNWENFNERSLPKKEHYSNVNMKDMKDADDMHAKRAGKDFERKNLGEYHYLYLKSGKLILVDVFENSR